MARLAAPSSRMQRRIWCGVQCAAEAKSIAGDERDMCVSPVGRSGTNKMSQFACATTVNSRDSAGARLRETAQDRDKIVWFQR